MGRGKELIKALESANNMCRSAMEIAKRDGKDTNWEAFRVRLKESLKLQHSVMFPDNHAPAPDASPQAAIE